jgi:hypothetical protein
MINKGTKGLTLQEKKHIIEPGEAQSAVAKSMNLNKSTINTICVKNRQSILSALRRAALGVSASKTLGSGTKQWTRWKSFSLFGSGTWK